MAEAAFASGHGSVNRFLVSGWCYCFMAVEAEIRFSLSQKESSDQAMGQVTLVAAVVFYGFVDKPLFKPLAHFGVAVKAALGWPFIRLAILYTGKKNCPDNNNTKREDLFIEFSDFHLPAPTLL